MYYVDSYVDIIIGFCFYLVEIVMSLGIKVVVVVMLGVFVIVIVIFEVVLNGFVFFNYVNIRLL